MNADDIMTTLRAAETRQHRKRDDREDQRRIDAATREYQLRQRREANELDLPRVDSVGPPVTHYYRTR